MENLWGRPLIGPAGQLLDQTLERCGLDLSTVCYFNVISCWPNRNPATPALDEIEACRPHFETQLALADPPYLLILGGIALGAFRPGCKIMATRGQWWNQDGRQLLATVHPAGVLRNPEWKPLFEEDLKQFVERVHGGT